MYYAWFPAMHTRVDVALISRHANEEELAAAASAIAREIGEIEREANCFDPQSSLSRLNDAPPNTKVSMPQWLCDILQQCKEYHRLTLGLFDITALSPHHTPQSINFIAIGDGWASLTQPGTSINLSGFIKGYAADRAMLTVRQSGITDALINLGNSSIAACGSISPDGAGWPVSPYAIPGSDSPLPTFTLRDECLSTSGNDTPQRQHILNPITNQYIQGRRQVSVISTTATQGEVLSTALFIANTEEREQILRNLPTRRYSLSAT